LLHAWNRGSDTEVPTSTCAAKIRDDVRVHARDDVYQFWSLNVGPQQDKPACDQAVASEGMPEDGRNTRAEVVDADHLVPNARMIAIPLFG
jgi:hypothetical protein